MSAKIGHFHVDSPSPPRHPSGLDKSDKQDVLMNIGRHNTEMVVCVTNLCDALVFHENLTKSGQSFVGIGVVWLAWDGNEPQAYLFPYAAHSPPSIARFPSKKHAQNHPQYEIWPSE